MKILSKIKPKSEFMRHVMTLMTGTVIAQAIPIAVAPLLTRIFTPESFGILALFMAITSVTSIVSTGRYELAIVMPREDSRAANLVALTTVIVAAACVLQYLVIVPFSDHIASLFRNDAIKPWIYVVPLMVLAMCIYQVSYYWSNRQKRYRRLASSKVIRSVAVVAITLIIAVFTRDAGALILGMLLGQASATIVLVIQILRDHDPVFGNVSRCAIAKEAVSYVNFPKYSLSADTINTMTGQLPVFLMTVLFGPAVVGLFALTQRVLGAPISLTATSICDVFKQRASSDYAKYGNCRSIYLKTMKKLFMISVPVFICSAIIAPKAFAWAFGEGWREAGIYAQLLSFMYLMSFAVSPLSYVLYIAQKQKYDLLWQVLLFCLTAGSLYVGSLLKSPRYSVGLFSLTYGIMYIIYLLMSYKFACGNARSSNALEPATA